MGYVCVEVKRDALQFCVFLLVALVIFSYLC